jgi:hypothetical protein
MKPLTCRSFGFCVKLYIAWVELEGYDLYSISKVACARFFIEVAWHPTLNRGLRYSVGTICGTMRGAVASIYAHCSWKPHQSDVMTSVIAGIWMTRPTQVRRYPLLFKDFLA